jgi:hypothetical protein
MNHVNNVASLLIQPELEYTTTQIIDFRMQIEDFPAN